jgi:hypothetical protein
MEPNYALTIKKACVKGRVAATMYCDLALRQRPAHRDCQCARTDQKNPSGSASAVRLFEYLRMGALLAR